MKLWKRWFIYPLKTKAASSIACAPLVEREARGGGWLAVGCVLGGFGSHNRFGKSGSCELNCGTFLSFVFFFFFISEI